MKKKGLSLLLTSVLILGLVACNGQQKESAGTTEHATQDFAENTGSAAGTGAGTQEALTIALPVEPATLNPFDHSNQNGFICTTLITEPLIKKTDDGELIPWLAETWEFTDDMTLNIKVKDGVAFHDGSIMTAEDVRFTLCKLAEEQALLKKGKISFLLKSVLSSCRYIQPQPIKPTKL